MMTQPDPALLGRVNGPLNVAPASSMMRSPGWAASSVACKFPSAGTTIVRPEDGTGVVSKYSRGRSGAMDADAGGGWTNAMRRERAAAAARIGLNWTPRISRDTLIASRL